MNLNHLLIGTSGYSYAGPPPKGWYGAFYPEKKTKGFDELKFYSQIFSTCEINNTFYRPPSPAIAQGWNKKMPDGFSFVIKLWQKFTHPMRIARKKSDEGWEPPSQRTLMHSVGASCLWLKLGNWERCYGYIQRDFTTRLKTWRRSRKHSGGDFTTIQKWSSSGTRAGVRTMKS
jgi:hypothetical protein